MKKRFALCLLLWGFLCAGLRAAPLDEARRMMRSGRTAQAIELLENTLTNFPEDVDARCALARALAWERRYAPAEEQYAAALSQKPDYRDALLGFAQLRRFQGRYDEALQLAERAAVLYSGDGEILEEKERILSVLDDLRWNRPRRYAFHAETLHENYNFAPNGEAFHFSFRDRALRGWDAALELGRERRFQTGDTSLALSGARKFSWRRAQAGWTMGAARRGVLLPGLHALLQGGLALKPPFSAEGSASFRRYREADVYALNFAAFLYGKNATLSCAYSPSQTLFRAGGKSGVLSSVRAKAVWSGWRRVEPWLSYARAEEAFEAGLSGAGSFKAAHYGAGASWRFWPGWRIETFYLRENRNQSGRRVDRFGLGASCLWGG
ncbi:MAG: tetratricopeptide repeat protein [Elusimicrobia bacterium]|nr:tetratricopeptide repeat protein [Elusimicrobiota bacterium]